MISNVVSSLGRDKVKNETLLQSGRAAVNISKENIQDISEKECSVGYQSIGRIILLTEVIIVPSHQSIMRLNTQTKRDLLV